MSDDNISTEELWKAVILYGLNQASYKMALGKVLLDFANRSEVEVSWADLSKAFLDAYIERLSSSNRPQQSTAGRLTKLERIVSSLNNGLITYSEAVDMVARDGFTDVVPRFQTIGANKQVVNQAFYEIDFGKRLILKDALLALLSADDGSSLYGEINSRWSLLEGAFSINHSVEELELANSIRDTFLRSGNIKRTSLTDNIPFLSGYQGNVCFYCGEPIHGIPHVDHVLPRQVIMHDHIWNLVLSHDFCNLNKSDQIVGPHFIQKLVFRNENIMGSNHPWKKKIAEQLGSTKTQRIAKTKELYELVKIARGEVFWGGERAYNPRHDPFYGKLITVLNNGVANHD